MVERYITSEMKEIWSSETKFETWKIIEVLACEAQAELGEIGITQSDLETIRSKAGFDLKRIAQLEETLHHDKIAFLTDMAEHIGQPAARWVHYGMTSSDLEDTALSYLLTQAASLLQTEIAQAGSTCKRRARETHDMLCIGRTHGVHAEPMTMGLKFGRWAASLHRSYERLTQSRKAIAIGAISGAVGTYGEINPKVEAYVCEKLGLTPDPLSTQVIARDRHAAYLATLAIVAATAEDIATELRALQRTDILEAEEPFAKGQKGSSAMPHKRNPIICERICGLARIVKANAQVGFDNVTLWHERDISHSSAERIVLVDSTTALHYMLRKLNQVLEGLVLYPDNMLANMNKTRGLLYSGKILLALIDTGMSREDAYELVQSNAAKVWECVQKAQTGPDLAALLAQDQGCPLDEAALKASCDPKAYLTKTDTIFKRLEALTFT